MLAFLLFVIFCIIVWALFRNGNQGIALFLTGHSGVGLASNDRNTRLDRDRSVGPNPRSARDRWARNERAATGTYERHK